MNGILETSVPQSSGGLSTSAKAGIGAGLRVAALLVVDYYCGSVEFIKEYSILQLGLSNICQLVASSTDSISTQRALIRL